jgi:hypothetical protein
LRVAAGHAALLDTNMRTVVLANHELGEYLRVDEIAHRFGVSVEDVLAAASVLGFAAHDASSLVEINQFEQAVMHAPVHPHDTDSRTSLLMRVRIGAAATAAVLIAFFAVSVIANSDDGTSPNTRGALATHTAANYKKALQSTYDATVHDAPNAADYRALAQELREMTPPPELKSQHEQLVAEAQNVALTADSTTECTTPSDPSCSVPAAITAAANTLRDDLTQLEKATAAR